MSYKQLKKKTEGFTIIEVLIVLAIAGLIMLIVFLAVPALQRNSRNTQARNEAGNILAAASEYSANVNGRVFTNGSSATAGTDAAKILPLANAKTVTTLVIEPQSSATIPSATQVVLKINAKCSLAVGDALNTVVTSAGSSTRQTALVYQIENSSGPVAACQEG